MKRKIKTGANAKLKNCLYFILMALMGIAAIQQAVGIVKTKTNAQSAFSGAIDWGLSYQNPNAPPIGNAENTELSVYDALFMSENANAKTAYLTFDAGYENGYTESILDSLNECGVKAAFFLTAHYIQSAPDIVKRMHNEGHLVCNHTADHPDTTVLSKEEFASQLNKVEKLCRETCGFLPDKFYRPPSGRFDEKSLSYAKELGYKTVLWSVTYKDWDNDDQKSGEEAIETLMKRSHPGEVILLHATSKTNSEILGEFINKMKSEGYEFKTLEELFQP